MRKRGILDKLCALTLLVLLVFAVGCSWGESHTDEDLKTNFKEVVGFERPQGVDRTKSSYYWIRDAYIRWLYFHGDDKTISEVVSSFQKSKTEYEGWNVPGGNKNPNAPKWWNDAEARLSTFEAYEFQRPIGESLQTVSLWVDWKKRVMYATVTQSD